MSGWFVDAPSVEALWTNLCNGYEAIGRTARVEADIPSLDGGHWVDVLARHDNDEWFDPSFFRLSPREAERIEPQQRTFLEASWQALQDGGYSTDNASPRVGVFAGGNFTSYFTLPSDSFMPDAFDDMIGADKDYIATRVAHHLGLQGPALTVQTGCSTSLTAVHLACQSLLSGECDAALAGGVSISKPRLTRYFYTPGGIFSRDGYCRAFDANATGTVFTDGLGVVLLTRMEDALARRRPIYAAIRGTAINNDGGGKASFTGPSIAGQERVLRSALSKAAVDPVSIGYVEAHGTATVVGDAVELAALTRVFRAATDEVGFCQIGSVKANVGHTASAAGVAGLMKGALALDRELIPPSVNFETPNPDLDQYTSPFFVSTEPRPWPRSETSPRFASVSSFGVGGANAVAILEEPPVIAAGPARRPNYVLTLSAHSEAALTASATQLHERLRRASRRELADVAYTLNVGRKHLEHRAAIVCKDLREARQALAGLDRSAAMQRVAPGGRTIGFLFPGQGAQRLGMGRELYRTEVAFRVAVDECLRLLCEQDGPDLAWAFKADLDAGRDEAFVTRTEIAQPLIFIVEYALGCALFAWGLRPNYVLGHSVGEFAAACIAGVLSPADALRLIALRGALMAAVAPGGMLSVALPEEALAERLPEKLDLAAVNGPRLCVVSGPIDQLEAFAAKLTDDGVPCMRLSTSHAFHSRMMTPVLAPFAEAMARVEMHPPKIPYISGMTGEALLWDNLRDPAYWARQVREPVRFGAALRTMVMRGVDLMIEVGPGRQLAALARQAGAHRQGVRIISTMSNDLPLAAEPGLLMRALAGAWLEGASVDWLAVHQGEHRRVVRLPSYPFQRDRFRIDPPAARSAYGRPKLPPEQWGYLPTWRRLNLASELARTATPECWLVFEDEVGVGAALVERLRRAGVHCVSVRAGSRFGRRNDGGYTVRADRFANYLALFRALSDAGMAPTRLVHLWTVEPPDPAPESAELFVRRQARGAYSLARSLRAHRDVFGRQPLTIEVVTSGVYEVTGAEPLRPSAGAVTAFAKVAPQENVHIASRIIDLDPALANRTGAPRAADEVAMALASAGEPAIALRQAFWWAQAFEQCPPPAAARPRLKRGGVYLITGGLGHVGAIIARRLAREWDARLVLVGRSPMDAPPAEAGAEPPPPSLQAARWAELQAMGAGPLYIQADIADLGAVRRLRATILERFAALDGVIFGAANMEAFAAADAEEPDATHAANFAAKVHGLRNVLEVFGRDQLDFGVVISSISTVLGGLGLFAYAASNAVADLMVLAHRRSGGRAWTTSDWDVWADSPAAQADARRLGGLLAYAIRPEEGAKAFETLLSGSVHPQVVVSTYDLQARVDRWVVDTGSTVGAQGQHKRPNLATAYAEPQGDLEEQLAAIWSEALGVAAIGRDDDFFDLGGHSLLAVQISVQIQEIVPPDAPRPNLYDHPTIRELAASLSAEPRTATEGGSRLV
jgi:acyl transferase domain-containing protein